MRGKFSFLYADIWFVVTKCKFIRKNSSFNVLVVFSPIFVADTKTNFVYNFVTPLKYWDIITVKTVTLCKKLIFLLKVLKTSKKSWHCIFSHTRENSKMFNITSKHFSFFNNKPPESWAACITRDFLTCYSCSYYQGCMLITVIYI